MKRLWLIPPPAAGRTAAADRRRRRLAQARCRDATQRVIDKKGPKMSRKSTALVTDDLSRFVPHFFD